MRVVMARTPCGFTMRTVTGVAVPMEAGGGSNDRLECEEIAKRTAAAPPSRNTIRTRTITALVIFYLRKLLSGTNGARLNQHTSRVSLVFVHARSSETSNMKFMV